MRHKQINVINSEVGKRVLMERKKKGYSQGQLASGMNLTRTSLVNIEKGRQALTVESLLKVCAILKCDYKDLLPPIPKVVAKELNKVKKVVEEKLLSVDWKW